MQNLKKKNPKEWWDFINKGLGRAKSPDMKIKIEGIEENEAAESLNNFFAKSWTKTTPYCVFPLPRPPTQSDICSIGEMKLALTQLDPRKASGPDGIPTWLLKEQAEDLAPVITHLANCSYQQGCVPDVWKESNVCPIPKGQDPGSISGRSRENVLTEFHPGRRFHFVAFSTAENTEAHLTFHFTLPFRTHLHVKGALDFKMKCATVGCAQR